LPFQSVENNNLITNFDLVFNFMTNQVAGLKNDLPESDPGVYVCSTDMILYARETRIFSLMLI
jgi:hypothetical protein